ncbi:MAG: RraA family protein [Clostridiaceae bacterium]|nr:RraA family protein [Clostridiaceae bacterium]
MKFRKLDKTVIDQFKKLDTGCISDAMDRIGVPCAFYKIKPITPGKIMCGQAFTVRYVPCGQVKGTVGDFLDDVEPGMVCVLDNGGRDYCTVWGDIMAKYAVIRGVAGTVIDGVCRDVKAVRGVDYPMFTKDHYFVTGKDRVEVAEINGPVSISGIKVNPGDVIFGDDSGALAIPLERAEEVLKIAQDIEEKEAVIFNAIENGVSLRDARSRTGYHHLQTKEVKEG